MRHCKGGTACPENREPKQSRFTPQKIEIASLRLQ